MTALTRDTLIAEVEANLAASVEDHGLVVGRDQDKILVFAPGGPFFAVTVEELQLAPKRERKAKA